nr:hypothetical protein Iba_chr09bCG10660 [Ipomoea batatas]
MRISQARSSGNTYAFPKCAYLLIRISNLGRGVKTNFDFTPALGSSSSSSSGFTPRDDAYSPTFLNFYALQAHIAGFSIDTANDVEIQQYVEALHHISIQGAIVAEQRQSNNYTNVMQQIANDELNRLNYGYVLQIPRTAGAYFYEPIDQVLGPDQRCQGNRRGRAAQGSHRRQHSPHINLNDEVHMEVQHDDPEMGDVTQQDFRQTLMSQSPFRTPYVAHGHVFEDGSSSQSPGHVARQVRSPSNQMPNAPFEHPIQSSYYDNNEETTLNTSQVVDPTQTQELTGLVQYQRCRPTRNIRRPPCGTE